MKGDKHVTHKNPPTNAQTVLAELASAWVAKAVQANLAQNLHAEKQAIRVAFTLKAAEKSVARKTEGF